MDEKRGFHCLHSGDPQKPLRLSPVHTHGGGHKRRGVCVTVLRKKKNHELEHMQCDTNLINLFLNKNDGFK